MSDAIRPGARVRVVIPGNRPCSVHDLASVPALDAIGTVDPIGERHSDHFVP